MTTETPTIEATLVDTTTVPLLTPPEGPALNGASAPPNPLGTLPPPPVQRLQQIEQELNRGLLERSQAVRAGLVALLSGQHFCMIGPPGTAKSQLMNSIAAHVAQHGARSATGDDMGLTTYATLITPYQTPDEIFGPISLSGLEEEDYRRVIAHRALDADLVLFDEIFRGRTILSTLLQLLNERVYLNGRQVLELPLITAFAATNEVPQDSSLGAIWDRMTIRMVINYLTPAGRRQMMWQAAQRPTHHLHRLHAPYLAGAPALAPPPPITRISRQELYALQMTTMLVEYPLEVQDALDVMAQELGAGGIVASDRRWNQVPGILRANALLDGRTAVEMDDLMFLQHVLWSDPTQVKLISSLAARKSNPTSARGRELVDQADEIWKNYEKEYAAADKNGDAAGAGTLTQQAGVSLRALLSELRKLDPTTIGSKANPTITAALERVTTYQHTVLSRMGMI